MEKKIVRRLQKVRERFAPEGIDGLIVSKPENQAYLTGFASDDLTVVITGGQQYILTDCRYTETVADHCPDFTLVEIVQGTGLPEFLEKLDLPVTGFESAVMSVADHSKLASRLGADRLRGVTGLVEKARLIKDEEEIGAITRAAALGDQCFSHMLTVFREGITEKEAALELEWFLRTNGAERLSFDTICIFGSHTSLPHGVPGERRLTAGDLITMDFGCVVDGYCSDMTRTVAFGRVTEEQKKIYDIVLAAQRAGVEGIRAGMTCREADALCRDVIAAAGYGEYFGHGTGHGVGLEIHEAPTLNPRTETVLEENMTVTIEPGIYFPKKFGIRIEDLAIVTSSGIINKVSSEKELIVL